MLKYTKHGLALVSFRFTNNMGLDNVYNYSTSFVIPSHPTKYTSYNEHNKLGEIVKLFPLADILLSSSLRTVFDFPKIFF